jgi:hypothetical protein
MANSQSFYLGIAAAIFATIYQVWLAVRRYHQSDYGSLALYWHSERS